MNAILKRVHAPDLIFFSTIVFLACMGLLMVFSSSSVTALDRFGDAWFYFKRQALFIGVGFMVMLLISGSDYRVWVRRARLIALLSLVSLAIIFIPGVGHRVGGALRWINLGGFAIQPGEFAKLACVLFMTWALVKKGENVKSFTYGLLPLGIVAGLFASLLLLQPDFGNAVLLVLVAGTMIFLAGGRISYLIGVVLWSLPALWALIMGSAYRKKRMLSFLDPWSDPQNTSYQILQSFTALYSGGLWGTGLGNSQEKLYYLPEVHTDFIGAVLGEELGFVGMTVVTLAFLLLVMRGLRIAVRAPDPAGFLLAAGCSILLGIQALLNLCVIMGLVPTKGLPLPFFSHGGSATLVAFIACGLIQSVGREAYLEGRAPKRFWLESWGRVKSV
jgi:cell division protein FtsW